MTEQSLAYTMRMEIERLIAENERLRAYTREIEAQVAVPDGWKLVPVEPTPDMIQAGLDQEWAGEIYSAMLAAAPVPGDQK